MTSVIRFSTCLLRLHSDISGGTGPVLVTVANTAMGYLHIHRQPLCRPIGSCSYHLLLLFRSLAVLSGGPTRLGLLSTACVPPVSRSGGPDDCRRYKAYHICVRGSDDASAAILLTRVYALWERNRIILWSLLAYYFGFAGFAAVSYSLRSNVPFSTHHLSVGNCPREI